MLKHGYIGNDGYRFILENSTEKPVKKCHNCGNILIYFSFCNQNSLIWKNGISGKKILRIFHNNFKKFKNLKKFDLRDLCIKRGSILRKLEMKIFIYKKLKFDFLKSFINFSFISLNKDFVFKNLILKEKTRLKGIFHTNVLNSNINRISLKNFKKNTSDIISSFYTEIPNIPRNFLIKTNFQDSKIEYCELFFSFSNLACKKKFFFYKFS